MTEKIIPHRKPKKEKRYRVDWIFAGRWNVWSSHRYAWRAKNAARKYEGLRGNVFRVVDTQFEEDRGW